jgi:hypothetical protein
VEQAKTCAAEMAAQKRTFQGNQLKVMTKQDWEANKREFRTQQQQRYAQVAAAGSASVAEENCNGTFRKELCATLV